MEFALLGFLVCRLPSVAAAALAMLAARRGWRQCKCLVWRRGCPHAEVLAAPVAWHHQSAHP
eukprot:13661078-Alexandrium_andersonii.AAC.1